MMPNLVIWNFYFLLKLLLFVKGAMGLDIVLNLLFLAFVILPFPEKVSGYRAVRVCRGILNAVFGFLLLWYDSWLPPISDAGSLLREYGIPSFGYIISFLGGFFSMNIFLASIVLLSVSFMLRKYKRVVPALIAVLILAAPFASKHLGTQEVAVAQDKPAEPQITDPAKYLESFYSSESERVIMFKKPDAESTPFDIVVLHVCSLSWDDLKELGMSQDSPFFKQFDYLFTNFNTATGYSGPAVMRLLQASCGQKNHDDLQKSDVPRICLLFDGLVSVGYEPYFSYDHDGIYGKFNETIAKYMVPSATRITTEKVPVNAIFFDSKTELYGDLDLLEKWFEKRNASKSERAALYYNTILLHAGSHWADEKNPYMRDTHEQFEDVSSVLLDDVQKFIDLLKTSKRNTVLIFVPEHGRALTGSSFQIADLRDIPLPKITLVPVGVKLIGPAFNNAKVQQNIVSKPTSYLALSWMLSKFTEKSPFGNTAPSVEDMMFKMPSTDYVSEHEGRKIVQMNGYYMYYGKDKKWTALTPSQLK